MDWYLVFITLALCATYFILLALFPIFFAQKVTLPRRKPWISLALIIAISVLSYVASFLIPNLEIANRILHIFGGGFTAFFMCFLAVRDSGVRISKFQFFVFSFLIVLALGTANELFEFFLQEYFGYISAATVTDTWLDLASNVVGIILASICFVPFHKENAR
jgi:uncharacterized membrane protein YgaE (UPF0421/DUF939 family)